MAIGHLVSYGKKKRAHLIKLVEENRINNRASPK